jgi:hypothetical protein
MRYGLLRYGVLMALGLSLGGCFEVVGHPLYNHGPTPPQVNTCRPLSQSAGEVIGYGCPTPPRTYP